MDACKQNTMTLLGQGSIGLHLLYISSQKGKPSASHLKVTLQ